MIHNTVRFVLGAAPIPGAGGMPFPGMMMGGAPPPAAKPKTIQPPEKLPPDLKKYAMMLKIGQSEDQVKGKMKMDKKDGNDNFYLVKAFHTKKPVEVPAPEGL